MKLGNKDRYLGATNTWHVDPHRILYKQCQDKALNITGIYVCKSLRLHGVSASMWFTTSYPNTMLTSAWQQMQIDKMAQCYSCRAWMIMGPSVRVNLCSICSRKQWQNGQCVLKHFTLCEQKHLHHRPSDGCVLWCKYAHAKTWICVQQQTNCSSSSQLWWF